MERSCAEQRHVRGCSLDCSCQVAQFPSEWRIFGFPCWEFPFCASRSARDQRVSGSQDSETVRRQAMAMDSAADGISIIGENGEHIYVNAAFARMMGHEVRSPCWACIGRRFMTTGYRVGPCTRCAGAGADGKWSGQISLRRKDGTTGPGGDGDNFAGQWGHIMRGPRYHRAQRSGEGAAEAETKYQTLVEQVAAISYIAELGIDGQWHYVSPQVETILGSRRTNGWRSRASG